MGTAAPVMNEDLLEARKRAGFVAPSGLAAREGTSYNPPIVPPHVPEEWGGYIGSRTGFGGLEISARSIR